MAALILAGALAVVIIPKDKTPSVDFHWLMVQTPLLGATSQDIESKVTIPLESVLKQTPDIKFIESHSAGFMSSILVRFDDITSQQYQKHIDDIRHQFNQLKTQSIVPLHPTLIEINSSSTYASLTLSLSAIAWTNQHDRILDKLIDDLGRLSGVEQVNVLGHPTPVLMSVFDHEDMTPSLWTQIHQALKNKLNDPSMSQSVSSHGYGQGFTLSKVNLDRLGETPFNDGETLSEFSDYIRFEQNWFQGPLRAGTGDKQAVVISVMKSQQGNLLDVTNDIKEYLHSLSLPDDLHIEIIDDQSNGTRAAIKVMQDNAIIGLGLILLVVGLFLGVRLALILCLAIPVILSSLFLSLWGFDQSLNITVLLGVVIVLGMVVDDSIVILEAISYHMHRGLDILSSVFAGLREVGVPVICTVLTTMATFLPLMLVPGILGQFMFVMPLVVSLALLFSLLEGFFLMPAHLVHLDFKFKDSRLNQRRTLIREKLESAYVASIEWLIQRTYLLWLFLIGLMIVLAVLFAQNKIRVDFFELEPSSVFYINVDGYPGEQDHLMDKLEKTQAMIKDKVGPHHSVYYSGIRFTGSGVEYGDHIGQILLSLDEGVNRQQALASLETLQAHDEQLSIKTISDGPPLSSTLDAKLTGHDWEALHQARSQLIELAKRDAITITKENSLMGHGQTLVFNDEHLALDGLSKKTILESLHQKISPAKVGTIEHDAKAMDVYLAPLGQKPEQILLMPVSLTQPSPLARYVSFEPIEYPIDIQRHNHKRALDVNFDLSAFDGSHFDASAIIMSHWDSIKASYPEVDFFFFGLLDDVLETLVYIPWVMLLGLFLVYMILGVQFNSFTQPFIVFITTPLALIGVIIGVILSGYPISVYTFYGAIALIGVAVNAAILLISKANEMVSLGHSKKEAILEAAKRRVTPIMISTLTTMAGLASLCFGWGGESLLWGPLAAAIFYGLGISTLLTLYCIPALYSRGKT